MSRKLQNFGLALAISGAVVSVLGVLLPFIDTYFAQDFGLSATSVWGVPGVNGVMQLMLLIGAVMLLVGVIPMGRRGLRFIVLEAQLTASGLIFFFVPENYVYPARFLVLGLTFYTLWKLKLLVGPIVKIGSIGTELLGWGKALNTFSGLASGGDLLFISSYLNYKRHGDKLDLLWTWLNLPFALLAHLDLMADLAQHMGWNEVIHMHVAGMFVLGASWFMVMHFRTSADLDGPHKPKPADELLPRFDLHWQWVDERQNWFPFGACGTEFKQGCIQSGLPSGTAWELDPDVLERRTRRHALIQFDSATTIDADHKSELAALRREIDPIIMRIEARWTELGAMESVVRAKIQAAHLDRRWKLMNPITAQAKKRCDPLEWFCNRLLPTS